MRQVVGFVIMLSCLLVLPAAPGTGQVPQATPGTSPVASQGSWRISGINAIAMDGRVAAMAPDGAMLAGVSADNIFCVWETTTLLASCADEELPIRLESIVWSPDGTAVAFSLDAVRMGYESDLYIYEVDAETLTNLIDDGVEGSIVSVPADTPIGDVPVWSPDSRQPAFTRSVRGEEAGSTMIMRIHRASGEPEAVLRLPLLEPFAIWLPMAWLPDGDLYYTQLSVNLHDDRNGIWRIPVKGGASELILPGSELADVPAPYIADVDPDRGVAVVYSYFPVGSFGPQIDRSLFWTLDLATGEKRPLEPEDMGDGSPDIPARVVAASYSPDGEEVVAWVSMPSGEYDLAVIDPLTGVAMDLALPVQQEPIPPVQPQWAANDTVMLPGATGSYLLTLERIDD